MTPRQRTLSEFARSHHRCVFLDERLGAIFEINPPLETHINLVEFPRIASFPMLVERRPRDCIPIHTYAWIVVMSGDDSKRHWALTPESKASRQDSSAKKLIAAWVSANYGTGDLKR
jgi:hypothetical protein